MILIIYKIDDVKIGRYILVFDAVIFMKKILVALLICLIGIGFVIVSGCSSTNSQSSGTISTSKSQSTPVKTTTTAGNINQDFSSMALTINDLPHGWMTSGDPTINATRYESKFVYIRGSTGVPLTFTITKYPSVNNAKTIFSQMKSAITNVRVDSLDIGDEGLGYQEVANSAVSFRHSNLIISISTIAYPPIEISNLQPYAELVDSRING